MSVTTTADEKIESAREHLKQAQEDLQDFLDPNTWGSGDYTKEFQDAAVEAFKFLVDIRRKL